MAESTVLSPVHAAVDRRLSVAPMMQRTDSHFRRFMRLLTRHTLLYTEMIPLGAILEGPRERSLRFDPLEQPVALQVGGADPSGLAAAAGYGEAYGYREINLNCGCPSHSVQHGGFGIVLMRTPTHTAECVRAMVESTSLPVTVKARIGLDAQRSDAFLDDFVGAVAEAGCQSFIIHARSAWLKGLSPKQNRSVPPLDYARVHRLARRRPDLDIIINGGIRSLAEANQFLAEGLGGAMIGRAAWEHPWQFTEADRRVFGVDSSLPPTREGALRAHAPYVDRALADGQPFHRVARPLVGLYRDQPKARRWRRALAETRTLDDALGYMAAA